MSYNPYDNVLATVENAANILGYKPAEYEAVKYPKRTLRFCSGKNGRRQRKGI